MNNVKNFGARGDNAAHDTPAVQRAIDAGGEVFFPAGKYVVGTLRLHGGTVLRFAPGAELIADPCPDYWYIIDKDPESRYNASGNAYAYSDSAEGDPRDQYAMLHAYESENVRICGGRIVCNDLSYCELLPLDPVVEDETSIQAPGYFRQPAMWRKPCRPRPKLLHFQKCRGVLIDGLEIVHAPCYSGWFLNCEDVTVRRLVVRNDYAQPNADGLHFSSCRRVRVEYCDLVCGDDCIAVDCTYGKPCEDVLVENCVLQTSIHAVRVYSGLDLTTVYGRENSAYVRGVKVRRCRVREACCLLLVNACDGDIGDVEYSQIDADQSFPGSGFCFTADNGELRGVRVEKVRFRGNGVGYLFAEKKGKIEDVTFSECDLEIVPKLKCWGDDYNGMIAHSYSLPYAFVARGVGNVRFENVRISMSKIDVSEYTEEEMKKVAASIGEERLQKLLAPVENVLQLHNCRGVDTSGCEIYRV